MSSQMPEIPPNCTPLPWKSDVLAYMVINGFVAVFMTMVIALRVYARISGACFGKDDWFAVLAWIFNGPLLAFQIIFSHCGSGYPMTETVMNITLFLRLSFAFQLIVVTVSCASKMSVLFFYIRVFKVREVLIASRCAQALVGAWTLTFFFAVIFSCNPVQASWTPALQTPGACIAQVRMFMGLIFSNGIIDIIVMAIPIRSILHLQMRLTDKIGVLACILLGIFAVIAAFFRGVYVSTIDMTNLTGTMPVSAFLSVLEPLLAVTCISIPTLRPLWRRYRGDPSSTAGTMKLSGGPSHGHSQSSNGVFVTHDTDVEYSNKDTELAEILHKGHRHFDESGSERNLTVVTAQD